MTLTNEQIEQYIIPKGMQDLSGHKYNRLEVVGYRGKDRHGNAKWLCKCECGTERVVLGMSLRSGNTKSCGCFQRDASVAYNTIHKASKHPYYRTWRGIIDRCTNPNSRDYGAYGGRGIGVCDRWKNDFYKFVSDMGEKPTKSHSIDRVNNNEGYSPENCRWATKSTQSKNRGLHSNNKSGIKGVCLVNKGRSWLGTFQISKKKSVRKQFSITKHGYENALSMACKFRAEGVKKHYKGEVII